MRRVDSGSSSVPESSVVKLMETTTPPSPRRVQLETEALYGLSESTVMTTEVPVTLDHVSLVSFLTHARAHACTHTHTHTRCNLCCQKALFFGTWHAVCDALASAN